MLRLRSSLVLLVMPVAVRAAAGFSPSVCIMVPTNNRPEFLPHVLDEIGRQDYPNISMVVIVDDSSEELAPPGMVQGDNDYYKDCPNMCPVVKLVRLPRQESIGAKRNAAAETCQGEIVVHWDDDDFYHPTRISVQVEPIARGEAEITLLEHQATFFFTSNRTYLAAMPWKNVSTWGPHFGTLVWTRRLWSERRVHFPNQSEAEDYGWAQRAVQAGARLHVIEQHKQSSGDGVPPVLFVCSRHGSNTWHWGAPGAEEESKFTWGARLVPPSALLSAAQLAFVARIQESAVLPKLAERRRSAPAPRRWPASDVNTSFFTYLYHRWDKGGTLAQHRAPTPRTPRSRRLELGWTHAAATASVHSYFTWVDEATHMAWRRAQHYCSVSRIFPRAFQRMGGWPDGYNATVDGEEQWVEMPCLPDGSDEMQGSGAWDPNHYEFHQHDNWHALAFESDFLARQAPCWHTLPQCPSSSYYYHEGEGVCPHFQGAAMLSTFTYGLSDQASTIEYQTSLYGGTWVSAVDFNLSVTLDVTPAGEPTFAELMGEDSVCKWPHGYSAYSVDGAASTSTLSNLSGGFVGLQPQQPMEVLGGIYIVEGDVTLTSDLAIAFLTKLVVHGNLDAMGHSVTLYEKSRLEVTGDISGVSDLTLMPHAELDAPGSVDGHGGGTLLAQDHSELTAGAMSGWSLVDVHDQAEVSVDGSVNVGATSIVILRAHGLLLTNGMLSCGALYLHPHSSLSVINGDLSILGGPDTSYPAAPTRCMPADEQEPWPSRFAVGPLPLPSVDLESQWGRLWADKGYGCNETLLYIGDHAIVFTGTLQLTHRAGVVLREHAMLVCSGDIKVAGGGAVDVPILLFPHTYLNAGELTAKSIDVSPFAYVEVGGRMTVHGHMFLAPLAKYSGSQNEATTVGGALTLAQHSSMYVGSLQVRGEAAGSIERDYQDSIVDTIIGYGAYPGPEWGSEEAPVAEGLTRLEGNASLRMLAHANMVVHTDLSVQGNMMMESAAWASVGAAMSIDAAAAGQQPLRLLTCTNITSTEVSDYFYGSYMNVDCAQWADSHVVSSSLYLSLYARLGVESLVLNSSNIVIRSHASVHAGSLAVTAGGVVALPWSELLVEEEEGQAEATAHVAGSLTLEPYALLQASALTSTEGSLDVQWGAKCLVSGALQVPSLRVRPAGKVMAQQTMVASLAVEAFGELETSSSIVVNPTLGATPSGPAMIALDPHYLLSCGSSFVGGADDCQLVVSGYSFGGTEHVRIDCNGIEQPGTASVPLEPVAYQHTSSGRSAIISYPTGYAPSCIVDADGDEYFSDAYTDDASASQLAELQRTLEAQQAALQNMSALMTSVAGLVADLATRVQRMETGLTGLTNTTELVHATLAGKPLAVKWSCSLGAEGEHCKCSYALDPVTGNPTNVTVTCDE